MTFSKFHLCMRQTENRTGLEKKRRNYLDDAVLFSSLAVDVFTLKEVNTLSFFVHVYIVCVCPVCLLHFLFFFHDICSSTVFFNPGPGAPLPCKFMAFPSSNTPG